MRCDRHNSRNNGHVDARQSTPFGKIEKVPVVEKKLRHNIIRARIDFFLEMCNLIEPVRGLGVPFRKSGNPDSHFGEVFDNETNQVDCVRKIFYGFFEGTGSFREIAPKRQHVGNPVFAVIVENMQYFFFLRTDAGEVGDNGQAGFPLDFRDQIMRMGPR